jgi:4-diphosphocytidyl-2-C-methyl-D-erythritol kinase
MTTITLLSPAKLNLFLHINGQLANGYHELQSLFHFLDYGDEMTFSTNDSSEVTLSCNLVELESESNLVIKAANALLMANQLSVPPIGMHIDVAKKLPLGGGVGGGSSNAATALIALNWLWQLNMNSSQLESIGNKIGADVPIFVRGETSIAEGTGEKLMPYPIEEKWYLVLTPDAHVNTAQLFSAPDLPRDTKKQLLAEIDYTGLTDEHHNDFEKLVVSKYPTVAKARNWLLEYAPSRMTGTGACVFSVFDTEAQAREVLQKLPEDMTGFVAKGCNNSPAHEQLNWHINQNLGSLTQ